MYAIPSLLRGMATAAFSLQHQEELRLLSAFPGPVPVFGLGNAGDFVGWPPFEVIDRLRRRHGPVFVFWIFGQPSLLVNEPALIDEILVTRRHLFWKNNPGPATRPVMGASLFTMTGAADHQQRRTRHPYSRADIAGFFDSAVPVIVRDVVTRLRTATATADRGAVDIYDLLLHAAFDCCCETVLGTRLESSWFGLFHRLMEEIASRGVIPASPSPLFWMARRRWFRLIEARIAEAAGSGAHRTDLLSWMVRGKGNHLAPEQLRDEIATIFAGGMRNIGATASLLLHLLHRNPATLAPVLESLGRATPDEVAALSYADLSANRPLRNALRETLRILPVVPGFLREVLPGREVRLDGKLLPDRTQIVIAPYCMHRDERFWPDPLVFNPNRFLVDPAPATYIPFGWGERACIGAEMTLHYSAVMVATVLSAVTLRVCGPERLELTSMAGTLFPKHGVPFYLEWKPRAAGAPPQKASGRPESGVDQPG